MIGESVSSVSGAGHRSAHRRGAWRPARWTSARGTSDTWTGESPHSRRAARWRVAAPAGDPDAGHVRGLGQDALFCDHHGRSLARSGPAPTLPYTALHCPTLPYTALHCATFSADRKGSPMPTADPKRETDLRIPTTPDALRKPCLKPPRSPSRLPILCVGAPGRTRTCIPTVDNRALYPLSYGGTTGRRAGIEPESDAWEATALAIELPACVSERPPLTRGPLPSYHGYTAHPDGMHQLSTLPPPVLSGWGCSAGSGAEG